MAKLVYKGKINGNDVVYKEGCINYYNRGGTRMNLMEIVTETGKEFNFQCLYPHFIQDCMEKNNPHLPNDEITEVIIKEEGKPTLKYNSKKVKKEDIEGRRAKIFLEKADKMYNEIRREIFNDLMSKPSGKMLERILTDEQIKEEAKDAFNIETTRDYGMQLYRNDTKRFIKYFSKIEKGRKKDLLNEIFSCEYENKEVIEWLNKNELELLREAGFNG